jgi:hypothetical protein
MLAELISSITEALPIHLLTARLYINIIGSNLIGSNLYCFLSRRVLLKSLQYAANVFILTL